MKATVITIWSVCTILGALIFAAILERWAGVAGYWIGLVGVGVVSVALFVREYRSCRGKF